MTRRLSIPREHEQVLGLVAVVAGGEGVAGGEVGVEGEADGID